MTRSRRLRLEWLEPRRLLAISPLGPALAVNSYTPLAQRTFSQCPAPAVAIDVDGGFAAVWASEDEDGSGWGVYGRRFDQDGSPQGEPFGVNTFTAGPQTFPSIAMDLDGDFVVTWSSLGQDGSGYGVYAQRFDAAAQPQGDEFQVNTTTAANQNFSAVAMDPDGDFVVTWTSSGQDGDRTGVFAQRYNAAGTPQGDEFQVNTTTAGNQRYSCVGMDATGAFVVTWTSQSQDGSGDGIFAQRFDALGTPQGDEFQVNTTADGNQQLSSVAVSAGGNFVIAWQGFGIAPGQPGSQSSTWHVYAQRFGSTGDAMGEEMLVAGGRYPSVTMGPSADFVVACETYNPWSGDPVEISVGHYDPLGAAAGGAVLIQSVLAGGQYSPSVAMIADRLVAFWTSDRPESGGLDVAAMRFDVEGPPATNGRPELAPVADQGVGEGNTLSVQVGATDTDDPPDNLSFSLGSGAPDGAQIDPITGQFTWTPNEQQGPGTYAVTVRVIDDGVPPLSDTTSFSITVGEVNQAPVLGEIGDQSVRAGRTLSLTVQATDPDDPPNGLVFSLEAGAPAGAQIHPTTGQFTWTPTEAQALATHGVTVRVTDDGVPPLSGTTSFSITVEEGNQAPVLSQIEDQSVRAGQTLSLTVQATDPDDPPNGLTFSLEAGAPAGAQIDPTTGQFTWTPTEAQAWATHGVTVRVTDDGFPPLAHTMSFSVEVETANYAPVIDPIGDRTVVVGQKCAFTVSATDPDETPGGITLSLDPGAPDGAQIDPATGLFTWTAPVDQTPGWYDVTVRASDYGTPARDATATFRLRVLGLTPSGSVDWGTVDFLGLPSQDVSDGTRFSLQSVRSGTLTIEASFSPAAGDLDLTLLDSQGAVIATSATGGSVERIDTLVGAGQSFELRVAGSNPDVVFLVANLVVDEGILMTVFGTDADDSFEVAVGSPHWFSVNGLSYEADPSATEVLAVDGQGGTDTARLMGAASQETAILRPGSAQLTGPGYKFDVARVESIVVRANGGNDVARLYDDPSRDETFLVTPGDSTLTDGVVSNRVEGFAQVRAYSSGGDDVARLYDHPTGDDTFLVTPAYGMLTDGVVSNRAYGFRNVEAYSSGAGDVARLYDNSAGNETFLVTPEYSMLSDGVNSSRAYGFPYVRAHSSGGDDVAQLYDHPAAADTFMVTPDYSMLTDGVVSNRAYGFRNVEAYSSGAGDVARLYDRPAGDDTFVVRPDYSMLASGGSLSRAYGFPYVKGYSSGGSDAAEIHDDPSQDENFVATPDYSVFYAADFIARAISFPQVTAYSSGGDDRARLCDRTAGADAFVGTPDYGLFTGNGFSNEARSFRYVNAYSSGGSDSAELYDSIGNDRLVGTPEVTRLYGTSFSSRAEGFREVKAYATAGGYDRAFLYDSALEAYPDHLEAKVDAQGKWARVSNAALAYAFAVYDFEVVEATASNENDTKDVAGAVDFLTAQGYWQ